MVASLRIVRVMQDPARSIRKAPLDTILTGLLRRTVARTLPAAVRALTRRRRAVIRRQAGAILLRAAAIPHQAVRTRLHRIHRRRLAMDRPEAGSILQVEAVEAEAAQDRTAAKSSIKSNEKGLLFEQAFLFVNVRGISLSEDVAKNPSIAQCDIGYVSARLQLFLAPGV